VLIVDYWRLLSSSGV